ncbi:MAG: hypothetical protein AB7K68_12805 [Bacteriovoracia bacterium]
MNKVFWAFLVIFAFGVSAIDACAGHFPSLEKSATKVQSHGDESPHKDASPEDQAPEHCCQIHVHLGTMPEPVRLVSDAPVKSLSSSHFLFYSDPSLIQNTRPPLAV